MQNNIEVYKKGHLMFFNNSYLFNNSTYPKYIRQLIVVRSG
jgi:hypothetical protein